MDNAFIRSARASLATHKIEDAARMGDEALVRKLLDDGANVEGPDDSWTSPLWCACRSVDEDTVERYLGVIRLLIERGARVDGREGWGGAPLFQACQGFDMPENAVAIAAVLIDAGADVNQATTLAFADKLVSGSMAGRQTGRTRSSRQVGR